MKFLNLHSIRNKLALLILLTIAPCLAILLYSGIEQRRHLIGMAKSDVLLLTHTIAEAQKTITQSTQQILSTLSQIPTIESMEPNGCAAIFSDVLKTNPDYYNIALVDPNGDVIASGKTFTETNLADRKHIKEALEKNDFTVGEYIVTRVGTANPSLAFAYPVVDKEGRPKAVLTAALKLDVFSRFYDVSQLPEKSFLAITDYKGIRLFYYPAQEKTNPVGKPIQATAWSIASKGEEDGLFSGAGSDGLRRIFAYVKIHLPHEDTPYLYVWAGIPESYILAPANAALIRNLLLLFLGTVISLFISWVIGKNAIIFPIQNLLILTQKFAKGDLGARSQLPVEAGELGLLTNAFHDMAESLTMSRKELEESDQHFKTVADYAYDCEYWVGVDGKFKYLSPSCKRITGYTREEILSDPQIMFEMVKPDYAEKVRQHYFDESKKDSSFFLMEYQIVNKNGVEVWIEHNCSPVYDAQGKYAGRRGSNRDITDRKQAVAALQESESRYRAFFENGPDSIVVLNPETTQPIEFNDKAFQQLGYSREEFARLKLADIEVEEIAEEAQKHIQKILKEGYDDFETLQRTKQGRIRHVHVTAQVIDAAGKKVHLCIWRDITEKVKAVEALEKSEDKFRKLYENAPLSYQSLDEYGNFLEINDTWLQVLGYERDEVIGKNFSEFLHPDWKDHFRENFPRFKAVGEVLGVEFEMVKKDGNMILVSFHGKIDRHDDGSFVQTHCVFRDITEERKYLREKESLENQLHQAQKIESIGQLAGGVAHDFNNMLNIILGYGNIILEKIPADDPLHEYAQEIVNAGTRSATITRQLLAFARKQTIAPKALDLNKTIEEMLKMLRRLIGEDIALYWHPSSVWPVYIDPSQLDQILANLCVNARDAINGVGRITIETETTSIDETYCSQHPGFIPGEFVLLSISDDGIGMDSDTATRIFEPFFTTKEIGKGTGLGLATVYGIVKQNQGFINVYSEPGHGTTFKIYLPRHTEQIIASEKKKEDVILYGRGETILVVEDEASILKLASRILTNLGYVVLTANSPQEAVKLAKENDKTIDLLITDVIMPEMNGRDLADVLLALYPNLKCLFMSGYTSTVIADKAVLEEGTHFIQKPFSARDLGAKVEEVLKSDRGNVS